MGGHRGLRILSVGASSRQFVFWFTGDDGLQQLNGGRGRDRWILFSPVDYEVAEERQEKGDVHQKGYGRFHMIGGTDIPISSRAGDESMEVAIRAIKAALAKSRV